MSSRHDVRSDQHRGFTEVDGDYWWMMQIILDLSMILKSPRGRKQSGDLSLVPKFRENNRSAAIRAPEDVNRPER